MRDINGELKKSYFDNLGGNIVVNGNVVPVYSGQVPSGNGPDNYVLFNLITNIGFNDDVTNYTDTAMQLMIVTKALLNNDGTACDSIADQIFGLIYNGPLPEVIQITNGQVVNTVLKNDLTTNNLTDGLKKIVQRILIFGHKIQHGGVSAVGNIFYGVQNNGNNPTDFSNYLTGNANNSISVNFGSQSTPKYYWISYKYGNAPKTTWMDITGQENTGSIGGTSNLFNITRQTLNGVDSWLIMSNYATGFQGDQAEVKFF